MTPKKEKKKFEWTVGSELTPEAYDPIGGVREVGFTKLADGLYADPNLRKKERKKKLVKRRPVKTSEIVIEESESGLSKDFTPSDASRFIRKESRDLKGIHRFQDSSSNKMISSKKEKKE